MRVTRKEIMPGVFLNCGKSDKFKTSYVSVTFLSQLKRETASMNALIPFVLKRGCVSCPDMKSINEKLDTLYGAAIEPSVRRVGEIQGIGMVASFPEQKYLAEGSNETAEVINFLAEILLHPLTRGGLLINDYVESEKVNLSDLISSLINNKRGYANSRCIEQMCCFEDIAVGKYGSCDDVGEINYKSLTKHYHSLIQTCPVEIFYFGQCEQSEVEAIFKDAFSTMPRGETDYDIGTDIRINTVEDKPRYFEDNLDVTQGKLVLGFRLGEIMDDPDIPAIKVFNTVYGGGVTSKLFLNVREKLQLCYYAASLCDCNKGIMLAYSGIEFDKFEDAKNEILAQLDAVKNGDISDDELTYAKAGIKSDLRAILDSQYDMESFTFANTLAGIDWTAEELSELIDKVTKEDVIKVAKSIVLDMVYFLRDESNGEQN